MAECYCVDVKWARYITVASVIRLIKEQNVVDGSYCNSFSCHLHMRNGYYLDLNCDHGV